jgi:hypothetical protein
MKAKLLSTLVLPACLGTAAAATLPRLASQRALNSPVAGDYVEARTASVYCGACHYNGELVTTGRDAIMAWNFTAGRVSGVDLKGLHAVASISSDASLGDDSAARRTQLAVDASATDQQIAAIKSVLMSKLGSQLGQIISVRRTPITFSHGETGYTVSADGFALMSVDYRADDNCCTQPHLVWYSPLTPLEHRKVGYTQVASYSGSANDSWSREGEDSAFYGSFAF